ncbi:ATP-binding cassette domain-containing protein [Thomasclavelia cocleata]|uniref:ATP-binding cassette domain-containing protein n=1 Tax=Thomasclavelia cocleata TaxID=69824 RepID=UPI00272E546E|nr:ATP-binding cassette domain-containing protein [Thomasclavelia cocleata]
MVKIKCDKCKKIYNNTTILNDFTYEFIDDVYFLKGKNGSGKSTLLRLLTGIEKTTSGKVKNDAKNILFLTNEGIGQNFLTIQENIELTFSLHKLKLNKDINCYISKLYDKEQLDTLYENASLGMTLKIGCTLLFKEHHWDLIIIDETFSSIDKESQRILLDQINILHRQSNVCVIITSHNDIMEDYQGPYKIINL